MSAGVVRHKGMASFYIPSDTEKEVWLMQHVPHRVCAALAWLPMPEKWAVPRPNLPNKDFGVWCVDRCVEEGRKAAVRWLIEFVVVRPDPQTNEPLPTVPHGNGKSVTIAQLGGSTFDIQMKREDARNLAKISRACAQASLHPTADTNHARLEPPDLASALCIAIDHLETALYKPNDVDLWKIVREQEELRSRERAGDNQPTPQDSA